MADWTIRNNAGYKRAYNILTCYTPMRETERSLLLTEEGARDLAARVLADVKRVLGKPDTDPLEVHIYCRGHPMYMATPGNHTRVLPLARCPLDRIFFACDSRLDRNLTENSPRLSAMAITKRKTKKLPAEN